MPDTTMKNKGMIIQVVGVVLLFLGIRGFGVFNGTILYFPSLIVGVILFAACLFWGGSLVRKSKEQQK